MPALDPQRRSLGRLQVPPVGMGTWKTFDVSAGPDIAARRRVVDACLVSRAAFIDTSPMYGQAERVLGVTLEGRRNQIQLATKVWTTGLSEGRAQIARSFDLLGAGTIDLYQIHNLVDWRTHLPVLEGMKADGRIHEIGITHYDPSAYPEMLHIMKTGRIGAIQIPYNVAERTCERDILPAAADLGIGVIVMRPLGVGRLAADLRSPPDLSPLRECGIRTWAQALLAWILADPRVSVVIPATTRPERVAENAVAGALPPLSPDLRDHVRREAERCVG
jgi:aryl-alcohol dehydrogenase-like predicted oxidoreductase